MLKQRVLSAIILIPLVALVAWLGGWWFTLFVALYAGVTAWELLRLIGMNAFAQPVMWLGIPLAFLLVAEGGLPQDPLRLQAMLALVVLLGLTVALFLNRPNAPTDLLLTLGAAIYLGMTFRFLALMRNREDGLMWLLVMAVTVWVMDSGAYFTGRAIGKHKFWPRISPKKTWEGFFGGLIAGAIAMALMVAFLIPNGVWWIGVWTTRGQQGILEFLLGWEISQHRLQRIQQTLHQNVEKSILRRPLQINKNGIVAEFFILQMGQILQQSIEQRRLANTPLPINHHAVMGQARLQVL